MDEFLVYKTEAIELGYSSVGRVFAQHVWSSEFIQSPEPYKPKMVAHTYSSSTSPERWGQEDQTLSNILHYTVEFKASLHYMKM